MIPQIYHTKFISIATRCLYSTASGVMFAFGLNYVLWRFKAANGLHVGNLYLFVKCHIDLLYGRYVIKMRMCGKLDGDL